MGDVMPKEQSDYISKIKDECLEKTNMSEQEAWDFGLRCWQLGYGKITGWIPVSKQLPEEPPEGLTDLDDMPEYIVTIAGALESTTLQYMGDGEWCRDGVFYNVSAWMPLPEAYKEDSL
jgi:hypothetical protein